MARWSEQDDVPREKFRLRPRHAFYLLDLAVLVAIFVISGRIYVNSRGTKLVQVKEKARQEAKLEGARSIEQADSVATAAKYNLDEMKIQHDETIAEVQRLTDEIRAGMARRQELEQAVFRLSDMVLDLRGRSDTELKNVVGYEKDVNSRSQEIDSLRANATTSEATLKQTEQERQDAARVLTNARSAESYDPTGRFPAETGFAVRRDLGSTSDLTNLQVEQLFWEPRPDVDLGVSLGVGLGMDKPTSNKELGLLLSRTLIHRRLGLDVGAGYSVLTESGGDGDNSPYASVGVRFSPFYKERVHFGLGARANHGEVLPYLGVSLGRR